MGSTLARFPDFLRLGLMLCLERRPEEPTARAKFIEVRQTVAERWIFLPRRHLRPPLGHSIAAALPTLKCWRRTKMGLGYGGTEKQ